MPKEEEEEKSSVSFGGIVATFGAILIALGVAWLVAMNWSNFPAALKVLVLVFFTVLSFAIGIGCRVSSYEQIAKAFLVLGALLYTLSVFLIAQIFSTSASAQGFAWLWLLSFTGVTLAGVMLRTPLVKGLAVFEFVIWVLVQSYAFPDGLNESLALIPFFAISGLIAAGSFLGSFTSKKEEPNENLSALGIPAILSLALFWIVLFFSIINSLQGAAIMIMISTVLFILFAYLEKSNTALFIGLVEFLVWVCIQYLALFKITDTTVPFGILVMTYFIIGIMFYGLTQLHKSMNHPFVKAYRHWTALYVLLLAYILSFQTFLPLLWVGKATISPIVIILMAGLSLIAAAIAAFGIAGAVTNGKLSGGEVISFVVLALLYILSISLSAIIPEESFGQILRGSITPTLFIFWIGNNILFISVILSVIGYGTRYQSPDLVNLGIIFFSLEIVTRYIGFIMDYGGQLGAAIISIIGGIILIAGGWLIEMWRRRLVAKTSRKSNEYAIY